MKKILISIFVIVVLIAGIGFFITTTSIGNLNKEGIVLEETYDISKEYLALRYRTDVLLIDAEKYGDYTTWDQDMTTLIQDWNNLEKKSQELEQSSNETAETAMAKFTVVQVAHAYSAKEITNIYDKAPKFKGIATLANHLGVDAKRAQLILNQAQDETTAEGWTEAGDTLQKLETSAVVIKDGCKVAGFVGGVVLTGGAAGLATAGTLTQTAVVVTGVDLALEVTEDGAQIAFGDKNKVSSFVKDVRTVTEPIANVLTITNIPSNLGNAFGKFDSVMVGLEQFREAAQEGKVIGVDLTTFEYQRPFQRIRQAKYPGTVTAAEMEMAEVESWLQSLNKEYKPMTQEEVKKFLASSSKDTKQESVVEENKVSETEGSSNIAEEETNTPTTEQPQETSAEPVSTQGMAGTYSGSAALQHVEDDVETPASLPVTLQLNESGTGTVNVNGFDGEATYAGNTVSFVVKMKEDGPTVTCTFDGKASKNGNQTVISGDIRFSLMGITFATYSWSAQK
jgi:hypothetical protein